MPHSPEQINELNDILAGLIGNAVRVAIVPDGFTRNTFNPQIAVYGPLEARSTTGDGSYRVLHDENNFCYFTTTNVLHVNLLASVPTVMIQIPVNAEEPVND